MIATLSRCDRAADPPAAYMPTAGRAQPSGVASECQSRDDVIRAPATRAGRPGHFIGSAQPKYLTISPLLGLSAPPSGASPGPAKLTVDGATPCRAPQGSGRSTQVRPESLLRSVVVSPPAPEDRATAHGSPQTEETPMPHEQPPVP